VQSKDFMNDSSNKLTPIERMGRPFLRFLHIEAAGGIVLLVCTVITLILANSPWAQTFLGIFTVTDALNALIEIARSSQK